jgi:hypothetical protein
MISNELTLAAGQVDRDNVPSAQASKGYIVSSHGNSDDGMFEKELERNLQLFCGSSPDTAIPE